MGTQKLRKVRQGHRLRTVLRRARRERMERRRTVGLAHTALLLREKTVGALAHNQMKRTLCPGAEMVDCMGKMGTDPLAV